MRKTCLTPHRRATYNTSYLLPFSPTTVRAPSPLELYATPTTGSNPAARLVELRYFGGLPVAEAARALGVSPRTADRPRAFARAWLLRDMGGGDAPDGPSP